MENNWLSLICTCQENVYDTRNKFNFDGKKKYMIKLLLKQIVK